MTAASGTLSPQRIMQMMWSFAAPLALEAAVRHRVFDTLDERPKTLEELARDTGALPRGLRAILNALVGFELLAKSGERYALTAESSAFLVSHKPGYQGALLGHISTQLLPNWLHLTEIVGTGKPATAVNQEGAGAGFFSELVEAIYPMSAPSAQALAEHFFATGPTPASVLDLAAGSGVWGIAMAKQSPLARVTAVDWAGVIPITRRVAQKHGVAERFTFVEGDLLGADFGNGHQLATLGQILHSEGEAQPGIVEEGIRSPGAGRDDRDRRVHCR